MLVSYPIAMVLLAILATTVGGEVTQGAVFWGVLCGISQAFGVWWFYAALGAGPISVVSPLTAILVAGIPVGVGLALGERPGLIAGVGVVLALVAVVLVSREATDEDVTRHRFTPKIAWMTVGAGVAFGLNFVVIAQAPQNHPSVPFQPSSTVPDHTLSMPVGSSSTATSSGQIQPSIVTSSLSSERGRPGWTRYQ